jgi:hypothetical protein
MPASTNAAPSQVIAAPQLTPPRVSLLTAADIITDSGRWEAGYGYSPEGCGEGGIGLICPAAGTIKEACPNPTVVEFTPYYVYAADKCSGWSFRERDFYGRAKRKLDVVTSWYLENELMTDSLGLNNYPIISPSAVSVTAGAVSPVNALAALEGAIADCSRGTGRMMIHVRPEILVLLAHGGEIRREGNVWLTPLDNIVVPGRGYPGTGPNGEPIGASEWIYATSMVQIRRGVVVLTPDQESATEENPQGIPAAAIDRRHNDITVIAERIVSAAWDPTCCHLAAEVTRTVV